MSTFVRMAKIPIDHQLARYLTSSYINSIKSIGDILCQIQIKIRKDLVNPTILVKTLRILSMIHEKSQEMNQESILRILKEILIDLIETRARKNRIKLKFPHIFSDNLPHRAHAEDFLRKFL
jgi:hypothetical protein